MDTSPNQSLATKEPAPKPSFLHPFSGGLILLLDNILFGSEFFSLGLSIPLSIAIGFLGAFWGVYWIQRKKRGDSVKSSLWKALLGGVFTGVPTSLSGTFLGTIVLAWSGLSWLRRNKS